MNKGTSAGRIPCECVAQRSRNRHGRIGKGCGRRKPVSCRNVASNGERDDAGTTTRASPNNAQESKRCDELAEELTRSAPDVARHEKKRNPKHGVRRHRSGNATGELRGDVRKKTGPIQSSFHGVRYGDHRIEMLARNESNIDDKYDN